MSILRTIALFVYLFGYMIVHYGVLRRGERALAAGDTDTVERIVAENIPRWSRGVLKVTGVQLVVEGLENIPKDTPCVFVGNHRSYYDIPLLLAGLDLGDYRADTTHAQGGSSQEYLANFYVGMRGAWNSGTAENLAGGEELWQALTAGAVSTVEPEA